MVHATRRCGLAWEAEPPRASAPGMPLRAGRPPCTLHSHDLLRRVDAMELSTLTPELPSLLVEMGVSYDPERLAEALSSRPTGQPAGRPPTKALWGCACPPCSCCPRWPPLTPPLTQPS